MKRGWLQVEHRGVYAVGTAAATAREHWMAAVLSCGDGALLSHGAAGALWGLVPRPRGRVDVTTSHRSRRGHDRVRLHRPRVLDLEDRAMRDRIPVTSVARTLLDLSEVLYRTQLERAFEEAQRLRLLDARALERLLTRSNGRGGIARLRVLMQRELRPQPDTKSGLERDFARFCRTRAIPEPAFNVLVGGHLVDASWPENRLIVELDSRAHHGTWQARERDTARDGDLQVLGHRVLRVTSRRLADEPDAVERTLRELLHPPNGEGPHAAAPRNG